MLLTLSSTFCLFPLLQLTFDLSDHSLPVISAWIIMFISVSFSFLPLSFSSSSFYFRFRLSFYVLILSTPPPSLHFPSQFGHHFKLGLFYGSWQLSPASFLILQIIRIRIRRAAAPRSPTFLSSSSSPYSPSSSISFSIHIHWPSVLLYQKKYACYPTACSKHFSLSNPKICNYSQI